ncbi:hypothetical protein BRD00_02620 [Halobacteriales archaeon QS_8_69_26]|nr:MAG: hypothetical protein BRD00_02620 [Halobacteriales archaeon QS_8_69_26]
MHGIVHKALKEYVTDRTDDGGWETVRERAGVENRLYLPVSEYPDEEVTAVLETVADLTNHPEVAIRRDFGRYFAPSLLETFDAIVDDDWDALETVLGLEELYPRVVTKEGDPEETEISTQRPGSGGVVVRYRSPRPFCPFLEGLVEGIGEEYGTALAVDTTALAPNEEVAAANVEGDAGAGATAEREAEDDRYSCELAVRPAPD